MPKTIKLHSLGTSEGDGVAQMKALEKYFTFTSFEDCDLVYLPSIDHMADIPKGKPLVVYCWDYYLWAHEGKHHLNWKKYAEILKGAPLVIVPSTGQKLRLEELLGVKAQVVRTGVTTYDLEPCDGGFILDPVRSYPEENKEWMIRASQELRIPFIHSEHQYAREDFNRLVSACTFLTCGYREASTGGLPLVEGLYLGKPSLISNSPYMGAKDYLGEFATYFQYNNYEDLKTKMKDMWEKRTKLSTLKTREYIKSQLSYDKMASDIFNLCEPLVK